MRSWLLALSIYMASGALVPLHAAAASGPAEPATGAPAVVQFRFTPVDTRQRPWEIDFAGDGRGTFRFQSEPASQARPIQVKAEVWQTIASGSAAVEAHRCQTKSKRQARTGAKTVIYRLPSGPASCEFNYSEDGDLNKAAAAFEAIAEMMQIGDELSKLHRFDRLGLDAEMQVLQQEMVQGLAIEVTNIAPVLQSIAADDRVMQRVRREAVRLLQGEAPQPMPL